MLVFLEYKTTGFEPEDTFCLVSFLVDGNFSSEFVKSTKKIAPEVSAQHHISNLMLKNQKEFTKTSAYKLLEGLCVEDILVVHDYELLQKLLERYQIRVQAGVIDTKRVTKHQIQEIARYDLSYLRYELALDLQKEICYNPSKDVYVLQSLYEYLLELCDEQTMLKLSFEPVLLQKIGFGKYAKRYVEEIAIHDPQYLRWMLSLPTLDEDMRYTIEYYLQEKY
ncbi:MAG: 3'-5' exonuclease [Epsilonproteobacteria bacterium]|nr:3'-5' exonuclease [Campylobacterota bacterium]